MKIGILGANGKMGRAIVQECKNLQIVCNAYIKATHTKFAKEYNLTNGVHIYYDLEQVAYDSNVLIDVSCAQHAHLHCSVAEKYNLPIIIGTTPHENENFINFNCPILMAANFCISWHYLQQAICNISKRNLHTTCIQEIHHSQKKDAPSGTAKSLAKLLNYDESHIQSLRAGPFVSSHNVTLVNKEEYMMISHQVYSRTIYAKDALYLANLMIEKKAGIYTLNILI